MSKLLFVLIGDRFGRGLRDLNFRNLGGGPGFLQLRDFVQQETPEIRPGVVAVVDDDPFQLGRTGRANRRTGLRGPTGSALRFESLLDRIDIKDLGQIACLFLFRDALPAGRRDGNLFVGGRHRGWFQLSQVLQHRRRSAAERFLRLFQQGSQLPTGGLERRRLTQQRYRGPV